MTLGRTGVGVQSPTLGRLRGAFYISGFVIILGADTNSEMKRQTVQGTTAGTQIDRLHGAFSVDTD